MTPPPPPPLRTRRRLAAAGVLFGLAASAVVAPRLALEYSPLAGRIQRRAERLLERQSQLRGRVGPPHFRWRQGLCFDRVTLQSPRGSVTASKLCAPHPFRTLLSGGQHLVLHAEQAELRWSGTSTASALDPPTGPSTAPTRDKHNRPIRSIELSVQAFFVRWARLPLPTQLATGRLGPLELQAQAQKRGRDVSAQATLASGTKFALRITASRQADAWRLHLAPSGHFEELAETVLRRAGRTRLRLPADGSVDIAFDAARQSGQVDVRLRHEGLHFASAAVTTQKAAKFRLRERLRLRLQARPLEAILTEGALRINEVPLTLTFGLAKTDGALHFATSAVLPSTPMARLLSAASELTRAPSPDALSTDLRLVARFALEGRLDEVATWQPTLDYDFQAPPGAHRTAPLSALRSRFLYRPLGPNGREDIALVVGPGTPGWSRRRHAPPHFVRMLLASEDASFWRHGGIDLDELQAVLARALENGAPTRGGSTISQQLVKNLYLSRAKTAGRKLHELLLTLLLESEFKKGEILDLYLSLIEWGPGVFGLKEAARYHFGRAPSALNFREQLYLVAIVPEPTAPTAAQRVPPSVARRMQRLEERMHRILEGTAADALLLLPEQPLRFTRRAFRPLYERRPASP